MSNVPPPIFKNVSPIISADNIQIVLEKLGYTKVLELFAGMGIALRGHKDEIFAQCAYITSWDYRKTKRLRDAYALSEEIGLRLTGFLIEASGVSISELQTKLRRYATNRRVGITNDDDLVGIIDAVPQSDGRLLCEYRYRRARVKASDLSLFHDVPVDTKLWVYDTGMQSSSSKNLYCVAIQPNVSSEYLSLRREFIHILQGIPGCRLRVIALKELTYSNDDDVIWTSFSDCATSNKFMMSLLDTPILAETVIKDVPSIQMFKWDRVVTSNSEDASNSESIEEDLNYHFRDLTIEGVELQKAKTIITAWEAEKHAASSVKTIFKSKRTGLCYDVELKFKVNTDGVEVRINRVYDELAPKRASTVYELEPYWEILWEYWNELLERYLQAVGV